MTTTTASTAYIAAATNRFPHAAHTSTSSLIALGSGKLIALWKVTDEHDRGIFQTIPGHEGLVTCVQFVGDEALASADDLGNLILWRRVEDVWKVSTKVRAHEKAISSLCIQDNFFITGSSDASVKIWRLTTESSGEEKLREEQTLPLKNRYPLALAIARLPRSSAFVLAVAETDRNIHLWVRSEAKFVHASVLSGHEDWVKALDFCPSASDDQPLVLASGSQDATIRLWNIDRMVKQSSESAGAGDDLLDAFEASLRDMGEAEEGGRQISLKRHILTVKTESESSQQYSVTFDALLIGHDAGVTSLAWRPSTTLARVPTLLSTSTDSSVILWSPSSFKQATGSGGASLWINRQRFGDIGGQRLGGFVGGLWAEEGANVMAWGWSGGWRRWICRKATEDINEENWSESGAIGGHSGPVKGLDWCPDGSYLLSAGVDQTTRIHGPIQSPDGPAGSVWHEVARPQVHGYDLLDAAFLDPLKFVSIADEKVARVFEAPRAFVDLAESLGLAKFSEKEHERPAAANVPPLGLSNKATQEAPQELTESRIHKRRPFEGELAQITLWPEIEKIFGHGYESISLTVSPKKTYIATACKASTPEHAVVRVYEASNYQIFGQPLGGHSLTVTRIAFSPDEKYVLSVSRDRSWRLFKRGEEGFVPVAADKSHGRIIWDCAWSAEGDLFMTASRDKTVKIWHQEAEDVWKVAETIKTDSAATALALASGDNASQRRVAIGLESGEILIYANAVDAVEGWKLEHAIPSSVAHTDQIHRLSWRPSSGQSTTLASCSEDGTIKILVVPM